MNTRTLRVARPTDNLDALLKFYRDGLGMDLLSRFEDHAGFDGVILGKKGDPYHFEFTSKRGHSVGRAPTADNLLVVYLPDSAEWQSAVRRMRSAGYLAVPSFNPYWDKEGATFEDPDGYRIVLQRAGWEPAARVGGEQFDLPTQSASLMPGLKIEIDQQPSADIREEILRRLDLFNEETTGPASLVPFAVVLREPGSDGVVGGLWAETAYQWMFIRLLFVPAESRSQGIGSTLMAQAEEFARKRGCVGIRLDTHSFQAPSFYEKLGYRLLGAFSNCPPGHADHVYFKYLQAG